jgi:hypothetical protein
VEKSLPGKILVDVVYVGNRAEHIASNLQNWNQLNPKYLALGDVLKEQLTPSIASQYGIGYPWATFSGTVYQALRPFPQYYNINQPAETSGHSRYQALQLKAQRQFSQGMSLLLSYTYAKLLTTGESTHAYEDANNGTQNSYDYSQELTRASTLPPQILNLSYIYSLPFGKGHRFGPRSGIGDAVAGGWRLSVIQRYQSGTPFSVSIPEPQSVNVTGHWEERPNLVPGASIKKQWRGRFNPYTNTYLNAAAFSTPEPYTFGNAPRTLATRGFAWYNEDVGISKEIRFRERFSFAVDGHAFNALNRVVFGGLDHSSPGTNSAFGVLSSQGNTARVLQVSGTLKF